MRKAVKDTYSEQEKEVLLPSLGQKICMKGNTIEMENDKF